MMLTDKFVALTLKTCCGIVLLAGAVSCEDTGNVEVETPAPRLISIVPGTGYVGCTAIISGEYFSEIPEENIVTVDGTEVPVEAAARNRLTLTMPQHELGNVEVAVTVNGQKAPTVLDFTYAELPEFVVNVAGINPQSGYAGDEIVITGENFDLKKNKVQAEAAPSLFNDAPAGSQTKAKTTRTKTKAKPETETKAEAQTSEANIETLIAEPAPIVQEQEEVKQTLPAAAPEEKPTEVAETPNQDNDVPPFMQDGNIDNGNEMAVVPEAEYTPNENNADINEESDLIAQLQAKVNAHNEIADEKREAIASGVWEGDPGDGTDFITVVDLPIEDQMAVPSFDMFDNPTTPIDINTVAYASNAETIWLKK